MAAMTSTSTLWAALIVLMVTASSIQCLPSPQPPSCYNSCSPPLKCCYITGHCAEKCHCFPGDATVLMRNGIEKPISQLSIGDEVAVWIGEDGKVQYDEVYAYGHADSFALSEFIAITLQNSNATKKLQLTAHHSVPIVISKGNMRYKKAKDVVIGDTMIARDEEGLKFLVTGIEKEMLRGLFNPFTIRGTILVNDVVASCHSEWFLDTHFDQMGLSHLLPSTYQAIMTPVRMMYKHLGSDAYKSLYNNIDTHHNIAESGKHFVGYLTLLGKAIAYCINGVSKPF